MTNKALGASRRPLRHQNDINTMLTIKIIAKSPSEAITTIERLVPKSKIKGMRVDKTYHLDLGEVYTVKIEYVDK